MKEFTYSEARQRPEQSKGSPLDVPGLSLEFSRDEMVDLVKEGRRPA